MKFKALRTITEPKEFVHIDTINGTMFMYTCDLPRPQPLTATLEGIKEYYSDDTPLPCGLTLDDLELVEFEMNEPDATFAYGADIRNKLTPIQNLLALLKIYFTESSDKSFEDNKKAKLVRHIIKEAETSEEVVKYLANLL